MPYSQKYCSYHCLKPVLIARADAGAAPELLAVVVAPAAVIDTANQHTRPQPCKAGDQRRLGSGGESPGHSLWAAANMPRLI